MRVMIGMAQSFAVRLVRLCGMFVFSAATTDSVVANYDPLAVDPNFSLKTLELTVHDANRDRDIPIRVYLPAATTVEPIVLFSHGLGGTRNGGAHVCGARSRQSACDRPIG